MKVRSIRLTGLRCFDDTGDVVLSPSVNIFIGPNNSGKSTLLRGILALQGFPFDESDRRPTASRWTNTVVLTELSASQLVRAPAPRNMGPAARLVQLQSGAPEPTADPTPTIRIERDGALDPDRPRNGIVPFIARRKAAAFDQRISRQYQTRVTGTFENLYARIDLLATYGHPKHDAFASAVLDIVGMPITTTPSHNGKEAGFYFDENHFVALDRMGDGVVEMVALIAELCLERQKIFVLEEPEVNLHPKGLKALLEMVRSASEHNQFIIATHSNIIVRELGAGDDTKLFRVFRSGEDYKAPSIVEEVPRTPAQHQAIMRELGYEFADLGMFEGWLFLEESSAESVIRDLLVPLFEPRLAGRLRTFAANGAPDLGPSVAEFQRLVTFVHLEPAYNSRLWIRADGDDTGREVIAKLRETFRYLDEFTCATFERPAFEHYYPSRFKDRASEVLAIPDKKARRIAKQHLLVEVMSWSQGAGTEAKAEWAASAEEIISMLGGIAERIA